MTPRQPARRPGRPPDGDAAREIRVDVRVTPEERGAIDALAVALGTDRSGAVRAAVTAELARIQRKTRRSVEK